MSSLNQSSSSGALALESTLQDILTEMEAINDGTPAALGQATMANSQPVVIASDQSAVPVSGPLTDTQLRATAVPVSGPLTDTELRATAVPVSGPLTDTQLRATAVPVSGPLTDTELRATAVPVSVASLPLPTGASTLAEQQTQTTRLGDLTETAPATDTASSGLNGRLQRIAQRLTSLIALYPSSLGQKTMANSFAVTLASDQTTLNVKATGKAFADSARNNYASTSVTTGAWVQLIASTAAAATEVEIFDSSGETLELGVGAASAEARQAIIMPGGNGRIPLAIPAGSRVSVRAISGTASVGEICLNLYN